MEMELELGLALPNTTLMKDFDLNDTATAAAAAADYPHTKRSYEHAFRVDEECTNIGHGDFVGWPPFRCARGINYEACNGRRGNQCVKVKKDGVAIARKVDLSLHNSYHSLFDTLYQMFPSQNDRYNNQNYTIMYQNENGDWMLVGGESWETFVWSVRRIKIFVDQCDRLW